MAKDGTNRGGPRPGTGPKRKLLVDNIIDGTAKGTLVMTEDLPEPFHIEGLDIPPVMEYLKQKQKNGSDLCAEEIYQETYKWLQVRGCEGLVNKQLVEQYAMSVAKWIQCEEAISEFGYLAKHNISIANVETAIETQQQEMIAQGSGTSNQHITLDHAIVQNF